MCVKPNHLTWASWNKLSCQVSTYEVLLLCALEQEIKGITKILLIKMFLYLYSLPPSLLSNHALVIIWLTTNPLSWVMPDDLSHEAGTLLLSVCASKSQAKYMYFKPDKAQSISQLVCSVSEEPWKILELRLKIRKMVFK